MSKRDLNKLTIKEAREKLDKKEINSVELTQACLDRIESIDKKVNAFITVCVDLALEQARNADARIAKGETGPLLGIPYAAKDNILTKGIRTTSGSKILENYIAPYDATVIRRLKKAGAVLLGKANLDQFGHGSSCENSVFGPTHNPWDLDRVPGGSSGGPAAALAADMAVFAIGTDTGGSIRCPASFCNLVGLRPSYGLNSRFGFTPMTSSTDTVGAFTKTIEDNTIVQQIIVGPDGHDATVAQNQTPDYQEFLKKDLQGLKIGVLDESFEDGVDQGVQESLRDGIQELKKLGAEVVEINLPHIKYSLAVYYIIMPAEDSSNLARLDGIRYGYYDKEARNLEEVYKKSRGEGFLPETKRRIMIGTYVLSAGYYDAYYKKAQLVRGKIKKEFDEKLREVDCILAPVQPTPAFKIGENTADPVQMYLEDVFMAPAPLTGLPSLSVPAKFANDLPVGMQLIGRKFDEGTLYRIGHAFEQATEHHKRRAEI